MPVGRRSRADAVAVDFYDALIRHGTTTAVAYCSSHPRSVDAFFAEAQRRNMLMVGGKVMMDRNAPEGLCDTPQSGYDDTKALIARFGTFAEALNAPEELLREIPGIGEAAITELKLVRAASLRLMRGEVLERPVLSSWAQVLDYCRASMGFASKEQFRILFLDKRNQIIADEVQQTGTVDHTPVYVREVVKRALELSATAIVLVHNHPSGDPTPSRADIEMTKQIVAAAKPLGVMVHDHIIVGKQGHASLKGLGLI